MASGVDIDQLVSQAAADVDAIETEIAKLTSKRRLTPAQKSQLLSLCSLLEQRNAFRSPVYKLSDDILMYIFELAAINGHDMRFPFRMARVASRWRRIALATPRLWSTLRIKMPYWHHSSRGKVGPVETALERSRVAPVFLHVAPRDLQLNIDHVQDDVSEDDCELTKKSAELVSQILPRCETASLVSLALENITLGFTARLRRLFLQFPFEVDPSGYPFQVFLDALEPCTNLEYLSLCRLRREEDQYLQYPGVTKYPEKTIILPALRTIHIEDFCVTSEVNPALHTILQGIEANLECMSILASRRATISVIRCDQLLVRHLILGFHDYWERWLSSSRDAPSLWQIKVLQIYRNYLAAFYPVTDPALLPRGRTLNLDELIFDRCYGHRPSESDMDVMLIYGDIGIKAARVRLIADRLGHDTPRDRDRDGQ